MYDRVVTYVCLPEWGYVPPLATELCCTCTSVSGCVFQRGPKPLLLSMRRIHRATGRRTGYTLEETMTCIGQVLGESELLEWRSDAARRSLYSPTRCRHFTPTHIQVRPRGFTVLVRLFTWILLMGRLTFGGIYALRDSAPKKQRYAERCVCAG